MCQNATTTITSKKKSFTVASFRVDVLTRIEAGVKPFPEPVKFVVSGKRLQGFEKFDLGLGEPDHLEGGGELGPMLQNILRT
jgi:hypothetical protein